MRRALPPEPRAGDRMRALAGWAVVTVAGAALIVSAGGSARGQTDGLQVRGAQVYAATCAVCHGLQGQGGSGGGLRAAPPLVGLEASYVDLVMRSGRMPIRADDLGVNRDRLRDEEREAALAWMIERMDLVGSTPSPQRGDATRGHELYSMHCAACHGATGQGGIAAEGTQIRAVTDLDPVAVVEGIRVGPFDMPAFDEEVLSEDDAAAVATFVTEELSNPPRTPLRLAEMHRVTFWALALVFGAALVGVVVVVGHRVPLPMDTPEGREK